MTNALETPGWTDEDEANYAREREEEAADRANECKIGLAKIVTSERRMSRLKKLSGDSNAVKDLWALLSCLDGLQDELVALCQDHGEAAR